MKNPRLFHGTSATFERPDPSRFDPEALFGPGLYLTDSPVVASSYAGDVRPDLLGRSGATEILEVMRKRFPSVHLKVVPTERSQVAVLNDIAHQLVRAGVSREDVWEIVKEEMDQQRVHPQVRIVQAPDNLNLVDADEKNRRYVRRVIRQVAEHTSDLEMEKWAWMNIAAYTVGAFIEASGWSIPHAKVNINKALAHAGYDGIKYQGGKHIPLLDKDGEPVLHSAYVIFPESMHKIRHGFGASTVSERRRR